MNRFTHSLIATLSLCAGIVLFTTGCAKEELVSPTVPADLVKHTSADGAHGTFDTNGDLDHRCLISDDGDDQGDKEGTSKPLGH